MYTLIGISKGNDILNLHDEIYSTGTELQWKMAEYEDNPHVAEELTLNPMKINWNDVHSSWNEKIFLLFVEHAENQGYRGGTINAEEEEEMRQIFFNKITSLVSVINRNRPREGETHVQAEERVAQQTLEDHTNGRKNSHRNDVSWSLLLT